MSEQTPFYRHHVFMCTNIRPPDKRRSCGPHGADALRGYMKDRMKALEIDGARVQTTSCLNRCELGPTMVIYPDETWYHYQSEADIDEIIDSHIRNGKPVERLRLTPDQR